MKEFFLMGGYAFYVWTAFFIAGLVLFLNLLHPLRQQRQLLKKISRNNHDTTA